jgi:hypothetical protein
VIVLKKYYITVDKKEDMLENVKFVNNERIMKQCYLKIIMNKVLNFDK